MAHVYFLHSNLRVLQKEGIKCKTNSFFTNKVSDLQLKGPRSANYFYSNIYVEMILLNNRILQPFLFHCVVSSTRTTVISKST